MTLDNDGHASLILIMLQIPLATSLLNHQLFSSIPEFDTDDDKQSLQQEESLVNELDLPTEDIDIDSLEQELDALTADLEDNHVELIVRAILLVIRLLSVPVMRHKSGCSNDTCRCRFGFRE